MKNGWYYQATALTVKGTKNVVSPMSTSNRYFPTEGGFNYQESVVRCGEI